MALSFSILHFTVFGQVSASLETQREFGNVSNLSNLFASQGFGGNATNVFGASLSPFETSSVFGSGSNLNNLFASNAMDTTNFPNVSTQGSGFGYNATNAFGEASSWGHQLCLGVVAIRVIRLILMQWGLQISLMYLPNGQLIGVLQPMYLEKHLLPWGRQVCLKW